MRKVFLEQNLGKKTKARFPKKNQKQLLIKLMIESQLAVSTPSLTQPLVIAGVSVIDFCEKFNQESVNFEKGLLIRTKLLVNPSSKSFSLELISPSVYSLLARVLQTNRFSSVMKKPNIIAEFLHNFSLIKLVTELGDQYFFENLVSFIKQLAGSLRSYKLRIKRSSKGISK